MMRFLLARAVNPPIALAEGWRPWSRIAHDLRQPPRKRSYQAGGVDAFLCWRLCEILAFAHFFIIIKIYFIDLIFTF